MLNAKPTPAQTELIRIFHGWKPTKQRVSGRTYDICVANGWMEKTNTWPYHRTTTAGLAAIGITTADLATELSHLARTKFPAAAALIYSKDTGDTALLQVTDARGTLLWDSLPDSHDDPAIPAWNGLDRAAHLLAVLTADAPDGSLVSYPLDGPAAALATEAEPAPLTEQPQPQHAGRDALGSPAGEPAAGETAAPVEWNGRTYGQLTDDEKARVRTAAAGALQAELTRNGPALAELLATEPAGEVEPPVVDAEVRVPGWPANGCPRTGCAKFHAGVPHTHRPGAAVIAQGDQPAQQGQVYQAPTGLALIRMAAGREAASVVRVALVLIGQVVRELDDRQVFTLGRRIGEAEPQRYAGQLHPFLAARLATADESRTCCAYAACDAVHPGFGGLSAAYAALAAEIEAQAADPEGYLADHLGAMDDAAAAARAAGAGVTRQQAYLERDQDEDYGEGDEARDCVRVATGRNADGQRTQWCATHRQSGVIEEEDDVDQAAADREIEAADDREARRTGGTFAGKYLGPATTSAVTVADPGGLLALVRQYGDAWARFVAATPSTGGIDYAAEAEADAVGTLTQITRLLGLGEAEPAPPAPAGD